MQANKHHGGPRPGSGAKKKAPELMKKQITVGIPQGLVNAAGGSQKLRGWIKIAVREKFKNNGGSMGPDLEKTALEAFKNVGDEGLFPNYTDRDIWLSGFKAGFENCLNDLL